VWESKPAHAPDAFAGRDMGERGGKGGGGGDRTFGFLSIGAGCYNPGKGKGETAAFQVNFSIRVGMVSIYCILMPMLRGGNRKEKDPKPGKGESKRKILLSLLRFLGAIRQGEEWSARGGGKRHRSSSLLMRFCSATRASHPSLPEGGKGEAL